MLVIQASFSTIDGRHYSVEATLVVSVYRKNELKAISMSRDNKEIIEDGNMNVRENE